MLAFKINIKNLEVCSYKYYFSEEEYNYLINYLKTI